MSFLEHSEGLGRGNDGERSPSSASASKFSSDSREAASAVFQMTTQVAQFRRAVDQIGSKGDTAESRAKLHRQRERITQLAKDAGEAVKRISAEVQAGEVGEQGKAQHAKLVKDFQAVLKDFQRAQKACAERERMYSPGQGQEGRGEVELEERESPEQEDFRSLLAKKKEGEARDLEAEHEYNSALIEERERGISDIQAQIGEVNDIFKVLPPPSHPPPPPPLTAPSLVPRTSPPS